MQAVSFEVGVTPAVPPSELIRYLNTHNRPERFTTPSLAAHLHLTVQEAQDTLNRYADEGLVAYAGEPDGIESWGTTQEGQRVLLHHKTRWTKKSLSAALAALSAESADFPITEISVSGRALAGAANGTLVVGLRLARAPYSDEGDLAAIRRMLGVIEVAAARPGSVAILLFHATVPHRLRHRQVLVGDDAGATLSTDDAQLDHDESAYRAAVNALIKSLKPVPAPEVPDEDEWAFIIPSLRYHEHPALRGLQTHFYYESLDKSFPMEGCRSPLKLLHDTRHELVAALPTFEWLSEYLRDRGWDRWDYSEARSLLALADYHLARGTFPAFVSSIEEDRFDGMSFRRWDVSERPQEILARLYLHYQTIAARRQPAKAGKTKPPGPVHYYAVFDCLNGVSPLLVAFVRQPLSHSANVNGVEDFWHGVLHKMSETIGGALQEAGLNGVGLSLRYRQATDIEKTAFDAVSAQLGGKVKYILSNGKAQLARERFTYVDVEAMPPELEKATWDEGGIAQLINGSRWRSRHSGQTMFDVIQKLSEPHRSRAQARLLDIDKVAMRDFAASASNPSTSDPVVLASGLLDGWQFTVDGSRWTASLVANDWSAKLQGDRNKLTLLLLVGGHEHIAQLAPFKSSHSFHTPYGGRLSSVYKLMTYLMVLQQEGIEQFNAQYGDGDEAAQTIEWYLELVDRILHSYRPFDSGSHTSWPYVSPTE